MGGLCLSLLIGFGGCVTFILFYVTYLVHVVPRKFLRAEVTDDASFGTQVLNVIVQVKAKQMSRAAVGAWHRLIQTRVQVGLKRKHANTNNENQYKPVYTGHTCSMAH